MTRMIRTVRRPSRRGTFLASMGVVFALIGYSYLSISPIERPAVEHALRLALEVLPLWVYGVLWVVAGALSILDGLRHNVRSVVGFTAAVIMPTAQAVIYFAAWLDGDLPRGWVSAVVFAAIAVAVLVVAGMPEVVV